MSLLNLCIISLECYKAAKTIANYSNFENSVMFLLSIVKRAKHASLHETCLPQGDTTRAEKRGQILRAVFSLLDRIQFNKINHHSENVLPDLFLSQVLF